MTRKMPKSRFPIEWIALGDLDVVWAAAQRPLSRRQVDRLKAEFDPDAFGVLVATRMSNGKKGGCRSGQCYHIVDGQHRFTAVMELWDDPDQKVPCKVIEADGPAEAADIWLLMNDNRRAPSALERFNVSRTAGHEREVEIGEAIESAGFLIENINGDGYFRAISAAMQIHKKGGADGLRFVLKLLVDMWGTSRDAVQGPVVLGMSKFVELSAGKMNRSRMKGHIVKVLTPGRLLGRARALRETMGGTVADAVARILVVEYNKGLKRDAGRIVFEE